MEKLDKGQREENYNHFIKECIRDLKATGHCYVYNKDQINEILNKLNQDIIIEDNECGYTLKIKKDRRGKNEFLEQKNKE